MTNVKRIEHFTQQCLWLYRSQLTTYIARLNLESRVLLAVGGW